MTCGKIVEMWFPSKEISAASAIVVTADFLGVGLGLFLPTLLIRGPQVSYNSTGYPKDWANSSRNESLWLEDKKRKKLMTPWVLCSQTHTIFVPNFHFSQPPCYCWSWVSNGRPKYYDGCFMFLHFYFISIWFWFRPKISAVDNRVSKKNGSCRSSSGFKEIKTGILSKITEYYRKIFENKLSGNVFSYRNKKVTLGENSWKMFNFAPISIKFGYSTINI